ncbi:Vms1/Ankzf1 family peptidyl-tRNA hydrolase [Pseudarthrobacter sp. J64]|uniref:baeRF2 domain-containing protein n=1 Tax=Pseudarthrobacter sp. J64 TaxID=3116485 RepID=UPI002E8023FA|nr:Vms1/Ankzf1 family peptidyl-tRNA hydrolase [Pseudarthrobacter sp. J64]MEE2569238.1 Vms1/Ankzf1 family peptidyl-tRNA hydrolase [Pseudarthrobacter sp. J64]
MTQNLKEFADLYRRQGPWCTVFVDAGTGTVDSLAAADVRPQNVRAQLESGGAGREDVDAVEAALQRATGQPSPVAQFILARQGTVEISEVLPGVRAQPEQVSVGPVPDLTPLARSRPESFPYVVAEVGRGDAEVRLHYASSDPRAAAEEVEEVQGSTENLSKFPGGGWAQYGYQHRTEEVWRKNADEVAAAIDRLATDSRARMIVLAGDVRARSMVQDQLSKAGQALVEHVESHTHTGGDNPEDLRDRVSSLVAEKWATGQQEILDRLAMQEGQDNPESATGPGAVVSALQQAQVDVLIFDADALSGRTFLALGAEPWIAAAEGESLGAEVLGKVAGPAALLRAAALTDAGVLLVPGAALPDGVDVAALLRWPTGPGVPASS